ncbi:phosphate regulon transcriptional regulatory protein PhoB [Rhodobacterales bacterium 52_120_T64]|nr:phosphate regulon transcriptional regulatory protein PhoB [Rhodobacterales bacterium 52_120_T64]
MSIKVLVVEDEDAISHLLKYNLTAEGFEVTVVDDGDEALMVADDFQPDIILLDWMLPNVSGIEICRQLRARAETREIPVIMLTARAEEEDRLRGFEKGADDYVTKPFSMKELVARIQAVLRRANPAAAANLVTFGDIALDRETMRVTRSEANVTLGPTEFRLLETLIKRPGRVYSREQLLDRVWGQDIYVEARTVDVHIGRLRKALNKGGLVDPIRTVRASGYALDETYTG